MRAGRGSCRCHRRPVTRSDTDTRRSDSCRCHCASPLGIRHSGAIPGIRCSGAIPPPRGIRRLARSRASALWRDPFPRPTRSFFALHNTDEHSRTGAGEGAAAQHPQWRTRRRSAGTSSRQRRGEDESSSSRGSDGVRPARQQRRRGQAACSSAMVGGSSSTPDSLRASLSVHRSSRSQKRGCHLRDQLYTLKLDRRPPPSKYKTHAPTRSLEGVSQNDKKAPTYQPISFLRGYKHTATDTTARELSTR